MYTHDDFIAEMAAHDAFRDVEIAKRQRYLDALAEYWHSTPITPRERLPECRRVSEMYFAASRAFIAYIDAGMAETNRRFAEQKARLAPDHKE